MTFDRFDVATRLRGLIAGQDRGVIGATANRLGVGEMALRMSVDEIDPHPTVEVLLAIEREYGVDPTWIVSRQYDVEGHRRALEIFDAETVIRRVRDFPADWYEWSEGDLYAISLRPGH